ncbi:holo-[acyl-carrier-protein] synthase [uncultured Mailhella sp.]|uniref:holo-[acyl-carrier-protein] synthase n=1 Tax=uncultured Mailhella sp. TaxID=1981031 RepID=UPI00260E17F5|nr:holo-[acyl-carrier-protein] synthase [uncultured Mailhella sp.]
MIVGIGFDLTSLARVRSALERFGERFLHRILTPEELAALPSLEAAVTYTAGRFAAKEAAVKALGTGFSQGVFFQDVEILSLPSGRPELNFHGAALDAARKLGAVRWHVSISHERDHAGAVVILES